MEMDMTQIYRLFNVRFRSCTSFVDLQILLLPFLVTPLLIYILRRVLTWWYHRFLNIAHSWMFMLNVLAWWHHMFLYIGNDLMLNVHSNDILTVSGKLQRVTASWLHWGICLLSGFWLFKLNWTPSHFREKKVKILDEVMEKETYKVAKHNKKSGTIKTKKN